MIKKSLAFMVPAVLLEIAAIIIILSVNYKIGIGTSLLMLSVLTWVYVSELEHKEKFHNDENLEIIAAKITIEGKRKARK